MMQPRARRVRRGIVTVVFAFIGAAVGAGIGLISSVLVFMVWTGLAGGEGNEFPVSALMLIVMFIVPIATLSGSALAATLYRRQAI